MKSVNLTALYENLSDGSNRGMFFDSNGLRQLLWNEQQDPPYAILKEKIISDYVGMALEKNSFLFELINRKVVQVVESGLAQRIMNNYRYIKKYTNDIGPTVLTLDHLYAGFFAWFVCVIVAISVFTCELCSFRKPKRK